MVAPETVALNLKGSIFYASLAALKSIKGSVLKAMFTGKKAFDCDENGRPIIDCDLDVFKHVHTYLVKDRTELPRNAKLRFKVESFIKDYGLDKGLASPGVLTTKVAKEIQKLYDAEPDMSHCEEADRGALVAWKKLGPVKLSWIAMNSP